MKFGPTLLISRAQVRAALTMGDAFGVVEEVLRGQALGRVEMPAKVTMNLAAYGLQAWNTAMPAYIESLAAAGVKWVGGFVGNPTQQGLPYLIATILVQDAQTGYPLAILEGTHITNLRTGAVAGIAARHFARANSRVLGIVGAGTQARFAVAALRRVLDLGEIRAYDLEAAAGIRFAAEMSSLYDTPVTACGSAEEAVRGADVVITATTSTTPLIRREWLQRGVLAISIGSQGQEFYDDAVLGADKLICDSWEQCSHLGELQRLAEAGRVTRDSVFAELGQTVAGLRPGREREDESVLVVPIGLGALDIALARVAYDRVQAAADSDSFSFFEIGSGPPGPEG